MRRCVTDREVRRSLEAAVAPFSIEAVFDLLAAWWNDVGEVSPIRRMGFETAVIEIAGNIVEHSRGDAEELRFRLDLVADGETLSATFRDDADPPRLDLSTVGMAGIDDESGRGLALASAGVDEITLRRVGERNVWTLETRRA